MLQTRDSQTEGEYKSQQSVMCLCVFFIRQVLFVCLFVSQPRDSRTEVECTKVAKGQPGAERAEQEGQKLVSRDELSSLSCSGHLD